ncbi:MAG: VanZ family protein [Bacteroidota bacterium]
MQILYLKRLFWPLLAIGFSIFIFWIIIMADLGQKTGLSHFVRGLPHGDKFGHFILYGILAFLVNMALNNKKIKILSFQVLLGAAAVLIFAVLEEFTQIKLQTRDFELLDIICDLGGIVCFSWLSLQVADWLNSKS